MFYWNKLKKEYCKNSFEYFLKSNFPKYELKEPFTNILKDIDNHCINIFQVNRQVGTSTFIQLYCLWKMISSKEVSILYVGINERQNNKFLQNVLKCHEDLPKYLKINVNITHNPDLLYVYDEKYICILLHIKIEIVIMNSTMIQIKIQI
jgi:hypothetical protein